jgi:hypothetical protein
MVMNVASPATSSRWQVVPRSRNANHVFNVDEDAGKPEQLLSMILLGSDRHRPSVSGQLPELPDSCQSVATAQ